MELKSILAGITIGLLIGAAVSLLISTPMLTQINDLQNQVSNLESQIMDKNAQIGNLSARISSLESQITQLQAQMPPERKGEYNLVATFTGQSGGSTDFFYLDEPDVMLV